MSGVQVISSSIFIVPGRVTAIEFTATRHESRFEIQIWRTEDDLTYRKISSAVVPIEPDFNFVKITDASLAFETGDFLGWYCPGLDPIVFKEKGKTVKVKSVLDAECTEIVMRGSANVKRTYSLKVRVKANDFTEVAKNAPVPASLNNGYPAQVAEEALNAASQDASKSESKKGVLDVDDLRLELHGLRLGALKMRARIEHCDAAALAAVDDDSDPKAAIIELIIIAESKRAAEAGFAISEVRPEAGRWFYRNEGLDQEVRSYMILEVSRGDLEYRERIDEGKELVADLNPYGKWWIADVTTAAGSHIGKIRLRYDVDKQCIVSNFKNRLLAEWERDIFAYHESPDGKVIEEPIVEPETTLYDSIFGEASQQKDGAAKPTGPIDAAAKENVDTSQADGGFDEKNVVAQENTDNIKGTSKEVLRWLQELKLEEYALRLKKCGYVTMESLQGLSESEKDIDAVVLDINMLKGHARVFRRNLTTLSSKQKAAGEALTASERFELRSSLGRKLQEHDLSFTDLPRNEEDLKALLEELGFTTLESSVLAPGLLESQQYL